MAQHISDFYTQVQAKDFARQFQFRVIEMANTNFDEKTFVYLQTGNLPGRAINNVQVPFMGLNFNVPGTASYPGSESYAVTFLCDQNYDIRATLENATFNTFDDGTSTGNYNIAKGDNGTIQTVPATLAYQYWRVTSPKLGYLFYFLE